MPSEGILAFRPVAKEDLPLLQTWLTEPHVAQWWDPAEQAIRKIAQHMTDEAVRPFVVSLDGVPFGYIQLCQLEAEKDFDALCASLDAPLPVGTVGLDQFIGPQDKVGVGLGPRLLNLMMTKLFEEGVPAVLVDPHPDNIFAIRAYEKAGLNHLQQGKSRNGAVQWMVRYAQEIEE